MIEEVATSGHIPRGTQLQLGGPIDQVTGHAGAFVRIAANTVCKALDKDEYNAYKKVTEDPSVKNIFPMLAGVKEVDGIKYIEIEDLQRGTDRLETTVLDIKMGFQTFRPDGKDVDLPKESYYKKASKRYRDLLSPEEHKATMISKARWMSLNNQVSSTRTHGFRIDGGRIGGDIRPLDPEQKTIAMFEDMMQQAAPSASTLQKIVDEITDMRQRLEKSELFMSHNLYGSSMLLVFDKKGHVVAKLIDLRGLISRKKKVPHVKDIKREGPPMWDDMEDGYLTGLDNLAAFFAGLK